MKGIHSGFKIKKAKKSSGRLCDIFSSPTLIQSVANLLKLRCYFLFILSFY